MFCPKCGKQAAPRHKFCQSCGAALPDARVSEEPRAEPVTRRLGHAIRSRVGAIGAVPAFPQLLLRIAGGVLILASVFLPYGQLGSPSLWDLVTSILFSVQSLGETIAFSFFVMVVGLFVLLIGGAVALFRVLLGGVLGVIGIFFVSLPLSAASEGFEWLSAMGLGFYGAWAGAIVCFGYSFLMWRRGR